MRTGERKKAWPGVVAALALFAVLALALVLTAARAGSRATDTDAEILKTAILRASVTCYAIEGRYPPRLSYLIEHYGVAVDTERYIVSYDVFADNLMPDVRVLRKETGR